MTQIQRRAPYATETVEVPEGNSPCPSCGGKGYTTKYEQGWASLMHSPDLAALTECLTCGGVGYVSDSMLEFLS